MMTRDGVVNEAVGCSNNVTDFHSCCPNVTTTNPFQNMTADAFPLCPSKLAINHSEFCSSPCIFLRHKCLILDTHTSVYGLFNSIVASISFLILALLFARRYLEGRKRRLRGRGSVGGMSGGVTILPLHVYFLIAVFLYTACWLLYNLLAPRGSSVAVPILIGLFAILLGMVSFLVLYMMQRGWGGRALKNAAKYCPLFLIITLPVVIPGLVEYQLADSSGTLHEILPYYYASGYTSVLIALHALLLVVFGAISCIPLLWDARLSSKGRGVKMGSKKGRRRPDEIHIHLNEADGDDTLDDGSELRSPITSSPVSDTDGLTPRSNVTTPGYNRRGGRWKMGCAEWIFRHTHPRRRSIYYLTSFLAVMQVPFLAGAILLHLRIDAGSCIWQTTMSILEMAFAPITYSVLHGEARFLRNVVLGPLKVSTRKSIDFRNKQRGSRRVSAPGLASSSVVDPIEIYKEKVIGKGAAGEVYKGLLRGKVVAIKSYYCEVNDDENVTASVLEASLLSSLHHENILKFEGVCFQSTHIYMLTELCENGNLADYIERMMARLTTSDLIRMIEEIAEGMLYLHSQVPPILHNDLKTQNLLVDNDGTVKICDFDISKKGNKGEARLGTIRYSAPEVLSTNGRDVSKRSDVYSFGVVVYEMFTSVLVKKRKIQPFEEYGAFDSIIEKAIANGDRPPLDERIPGEVRRLIAACWVHTPSERPPFDDIIAKIREMER